MVYLFNFFSSLRSGIIYNYYDILCCKIFPQDLFYVKRVNTKSNNKICRNHCYCYPYTVYLLRKCYFF